jgi:cyclopropane-fatty-acyl-phospholipid synthase
MAAPAFDLRASQLCSVLGEIFADYHDIPFEIRLWDGQVWRSAPDAAHTFSIVLRRAAALRRMFWTPTWLGLAEAFIENDYDVEGDLERAMAFARYLCTHHLTFRKKFHVARTVLALTAGPPRGAAPGGAKVSGPSHSPSRDAQAVRYHYDLPGEFYGLWLDPGMNYSCGYFRAANDTLDLAQEQKLDYVCRKLRLQRGERLLDIGCGWGSLLLHAARNYGVEATGITLSPPQAEWARGRIAAAGLSRVCRVEVTDYRELMGEFDKLASIGMVEHVGAIRLREYFSVVRRLLKPGGCFLLQGIGGRWGGTIPEGDFIRKYVFPDTELIPISRMLEAAETEGFEVRDVENLREHYRQTVRHWLRRLEACAGEARRIAGQRTYRIYRLYLAGVSEYFARAEINVFQSLLSLPQSGGDPLPVTREGWYH